jgi:hypothetical protein
VRELLPEFWRDAQGSTQRRLVEAIQNAEKRGGKSQRLRHCDRCRASGALHIAPIVFPTRSGVPHIHVGRANEQ